MTGRLAPGSRRKRATPPAGWRTRIPAAVPLFLIGAIAFGVSYVAFRMIVEGPGHLPIWSLFTATGAILCAGGTAVLVAGGEEPLEESPFFDAERFVLIPREEYDELRATQATAASETPLAVEVPELAPPAPVPTVPLGAAGEAPRPWDETPLTAERPIRRRRASDLDEAMREVESVLASLTEPAPQSAPPQIPERAEPPVESAVVVSTLPTSHTLGVEPLTSPAPLRSPEPAAAAGVCTSCGTRIKGVATARHCSACEEPLCLACAARAEWEGHAEFCPRCHGLLVLSRGDDDARGPP